MTATCLKTKGIEAVLRICCCAAVSIVSHGRKTTALSLTVSIAFQNVLPGRARARPGSRPLLARRALGPRRCRRVFLRLRLVRRRLIGRLDAKMILHFTHAGHLFDGVFGSAFLLPRANR